MTISTDPMDLVLGVNAAAEARVRLPNPHHPHDPPAVIRHHATSDIRQSECWGYAGSGPSDVALNTLQAFLPGQDGFECWDGTRVSQAAADHYQEFKEIFLVPLPKWGGVIPAATIRAWLQDRIAR